MKSFRVLVLSILVLIIGLLTACGGGGSHPPAPPTPLSITTTLVPTATVNVQFNFFLQATGGTGTFTWGIKSGTSLPPGLTINPQLGQITGTPTKQGVYSITPQVTDGAGTVATTTLSMTVEGVVLISCSSCTGSALPFGNPGVAYSTSLTASGGNGTYNWCVVETNGNCDNGAGGGLPPGLTLTTSNNTGVIAGTPTTPGTPQQVTIQASDTENPVSRSTMTLTLTIFGAGPTTLPNGTLNTPYNQNVVALGGLGPYTWAPPTGTLPPGLSLGTCIRSQRPTCPISGTPTQEGTWTFSVQVTDGENPPASASVNATITIGSLASNATLNGQYAIVLTGFKNGNPYNMVGSFTADGNGNVTGGKIDYNDGSGEPNDSNQCHGSRICPIAQVIQGGSTYDLSAGTGLGTMTIHTTDNGGNPHAYDFTIAVSGDGSSCKTARTYSSCGRLIENDSLENGSGVLKVQDPAVFAIHTFFPGNFAMLVTGTDPHGNRYAAAGAVGTNPGTYNDIDCNGNGWGLQGGCPLDTNDNGNNGVGTTLPDPLGGTFSTDLDNVTGRGTFVSMQFPSDPQGLCLGSQQQSYNCGFAYYIINYTEMVLISGDPTTSSGNPYANLTIWSAFRQKSVAPGWSLALLSPANVMELNANDANKADVTVGLMTTDGAGNGTFTSDENDGGTMNQQTAAPGTIALGTDGLHTGQFLFSGFPQFGAGGAVMYVWSGNTGNGGYFVGSDAKVTSGVMEPQTGSNFTDAAVSGNYVGASVFPVLPAVTNSVTYLHADGIGTISGTQESSGGNTGLSLTYQVDGTGRGVVLDQNNNPYAYLYVIGSGASGSKFAWVPTGSLPALNVFADGQPD